MSQNLIDKCILCVGGTVLETYISHKNFKIIRCNNCGLLFQKDVMPESELDLYNNIYAEEGRPNENRFYWQNRMKKYYNDITQHIKIPGNILDIGCSYGFLMEFFQKRGWKAIGLDLSQDAIKCAKEKGLECSLSSIETFETGKKFNAIVMSNIIEHLKNPIECLNRVKKWLAPDGIIYIRVPNIDSVVLASSKQSFIGDLKPFEHLYYFNAHALDLLLSKSGLNSILTTDGRVTLGNMLNCFIRSKFVLKSSWQNLNYRADAKKKKNYLWLKHIYGEVLITLGNVPFGPNNRELVAIARAN